MPKARIKPKYKGNHVQAKDRKPRHRPNVNTPPYSNSATQITPSLNVSSRKLSTNDNDEYQESGEGNIIFDLYLVGNCINTFVKCYVF